MLQFVGGVASMVSRGKGNITVAFLPNPLGSAGVLWLYPCDDIDLKVLRELLDAKLPAVLHDLPDHGEG